MWPAGLIIAIFSINWRLLVEAASVNKDRSNMKFMKLCTYADRLFK